MTNKVEVLKQMGKNIVKIRHARGMTQEELSAFSGVCITHIRNIEHGNINVSFEKLADLANALDVPVYMLGLLSYEDERLLNQLHKVKAELGLLEPEEWLTMKYRYMVNQVNYFGHISYGLLVQEKQGEFWAFTTAVGPFTENGPAVSALADKCNAQQVPTERLLDIVHDYMEQEAQTFVPA